MTKFKVGDRVRSRIELYSLPGFPPEDAIPVNSAGTVDYVHTTFGESYGVVFDCDRNQMSTHMDPGDLEAL